MALQLSPELQHAVHASPDDLELVDPVTITLYVIIAKDRWRERTAIDQAAAHDRAHGSTAADAADQWTDDKNRRRAALVDREIAGILTDSEQAELTLLQRQMRAFRDRIAPLPLEDTRQLHAELMEKAREAQARKA